MVKADKYPQKPANKDLTIPYKFNNYPTIITIPPINLIKPHNFNETYGGKYRKKRKKPSPETSPDWAFILKNIRKTPF